MAALLSRFICVGYQGKYMECVSTEGDSNGLMQLSGEDPLSPKARIEVEKSMCSPDEMVHFKCCYKNKYLRRRSETDDSLAALATEPEEDQSKWSCTLIRPRPRPRTFESDVQADSLPLPLPPISNDFDIQIMAPPPPHQPNSGGPANSYFLCPTHTEDGQTAESAVLKMSSRTTTFTVTDAESVVQLPRFVIFKALNGNYLRPVHDINSGNLFSEIVADVEDYMDAPVFDVSRMVDGSVTLRPCFFPMGNPFLKFKDSKLILNDDIPFHPDHLETRFRPVKLGSNTNDIGLRILSNNRFCKIHQTTSRLVATSSQIEGEAVLEVEEAVGTRSVYEINYRMEDAKLYDFAPVTSVTKDVKNESETTQAGELTFTYTETKSENWGNMDSWGAGVTVSIKTRVPFVKVEAGVGAEFEGEYNWGEAKETETEIETQLQVEVPPMSRTQVTMIVSRGTLVVPFSYTQRDNLYNGQLIVTQVDGGVFTGVNSYVSYETTQKSL